jgi:hypothetical protein
VSTDHGPHAPTGHSRRGADDPAMTLAVYGEKARAAAGLAEVATVPGKHFPQEDQAPAIARKIAEQALRAQPEPIGEE